VNGTLDSKVGMTLKTTGAGSDIALSSTGQLKNGSGTLALDAADCRYN
jgi:hypothetical protein